MENRVIKFRAWDIDRKIMVDDLLSDSYDKKLKEMGLLEYEYIRALRGEYKSQFSLMQFTGLTDKNGIRTC